VVLVLFLFVKNIIVCIDLLQNRALQYFEADFEAEDYPMLMVQLPNTDDKLYSLTVANPYQPRMLTENA